VAHAPKTITPAIRKRRRSLGRQVWLEAARQALVEEGTTGIEVNKLAKRLGVTRGGFQWFFKSRQRLLDELLAYWLDTSTCLFERILETYDHDGMREYMALINLWVEEKDYDPKWDTAMRDWARTTVKVRKAIQSVDAKRIAVLQEIFMHMGYKGKEAHIRARITYYHQVGYYALGVRESRKRRLDLLSYYIKVLTGRDA
jgi:AcrR family transcriptional regulator